MVTPLLETERLWMRPMALSDAPSIQSHFANWNIIRHMSTAVPWPYPEDGAETWIRDFMLPKMEQGDVLAWVLELKAGPPGAIGVLEYRPATAERSDNRGFWLAEPYHGQGLMTEAVTAFQDYLFFDLGIERILVMNAVGNQGSRRVKEKTGARYLGIVSMDHNNGQSDTEQWEVTRSVWAALRGRD